MYWTAWQNQTDGNVFMASMEWWWSLLLVGGMSAGLTLLMVLVEEVLMMLLLSEPTLSSHMLLGRKSTKVPECLGELVSSAIVPALRR